MNILLNSAQIAEISTKVGFEISYICTTKGKFFIYGNDEQYAEASYLIDFINRNLKVTIDYIGSAFLEKEIEFTMNF